MINFTQSMALELSDDAIRVNTVSPDHTITPGGRGNRSGPVDPSTWLQRSPDAQDAMNRLIPLGRDGADIACGHAVAFLCSSTARYITGFNLPVDDGTAHAPRCQPNPSRTWTPIPGHNRHHRDKGQ